MVKQIGQTKDVGFQFGIRRTFPISAETAWDFMFSKTGLEIWLGQLVSELEIKKEYKTKNGISGLVRVFKPKSHIRMNWKKKYWKNMSTVQVRVFGNSEKSTIAFHQENLFNAEQRREMKEHWNGIMDLIALEIEKSGC